MTWRVTTDAVWIAIGLGICGLTTLSRRSASVPRAAVAVRRALAHPAARAGVVALWMWLGWHTFAR